MMFESLKPPSSPFESPTLLHRIVSSPIRLLAQQLYALQGFFRRRSPCSFAEAQRVRVLCISDTHCHKPHSLPTADVLIHAGDLTNQGTVQEIQDQLSWLAKLDYKYKIVISGNHDSYFDPRSRRQVDKDSTLDWGSKDQGLIYLQHSSTTIHFPDKGGRHLRIYGAPQIPACGGPEFAFQYPRGQDAWTDLIPKDTDILVTHSPPRHHLDLPKGMGCEWLLKEAWNVKARLHVFGHVHCGHGQEDLTWDESQKIYERLCNRSESGIFWDLIDIFAWIELFRLLVRGVTGLLWSQVWGGNNESTLLVNAALMTGSTGRLGNAPQVVEI